MTRILVVLCLIAAAACSKKESAPAAQAGSTPAEQAAAAPPKPMPAQLPDVIARVNGKDISKADFETAIKNLEQRAGGAVPPDQRDKVYRDVLDQLIGFELLTQEAANRKLDIPAAEVDSRLEVFRQHFGTPAEFDKALAAQKTTFAELRQQTLSEMRIEKLLKDEVETKVSVGQKELDEFYKGNPEQFKQDERVRASHILFTVAADADAKTKDAARAKAADILKQIKSGQDFAALAQKHSQDPGTAPAGGDLNFFGRGQMVPAFEEAAFALKPGEVSGVVESPFGFHVIKLTEREAGKVLTLDEVRPRLEEFLKERQRQEKTNAFVTTLRGKGKVEVLV